MNYPDWSNGTICTDGGYVIVREGMSVDDYSSSPLPVHIARESLGDRAEWMSLGPLKIDSIDWYAAIFFYDRIVSGADLCPVPGTFDFDDNNQSIERGAEILRNHNINALSDSTGRPPGAEYSWGWIASIENQYEINILIRLTYLRSN